jgi:hypothetical protein
VNDGVKVTEIIGDAVWDGISVGVIFGAADTLTVMLAGTLTASGTLLHPVTNAIIKRRGNNVFMMPIFNVPPNGSRYLRWGGDGEAVQPACPACTLPQAQVDDSPGKNDEA